MTADDPPTPSLSNGALLRARLAAIVESSDDAIISKDLNGVIETWNRGAQRIFGYTADEVVGQPITILIPADRHDEEPEILARIRRGERIDHYRTIRRRKDGSMVHISLSVSPIADAQGRIVGASKIARDITHEFEAEQQRNELLRAAEAAREEAQAANRAKDEFLAMLGHELRNPLGAVRNALTAAMLDSQTRERALEIARRQTDHLTRIVDDLLDVARITQGRVPLRKAPVPIARVLKQAADAVQPLLDDRHHRFQLASPDDTLLVHADADRLQQAVANLLSNAAKYTDLGGDVTLRADRDGDQVAIRVRDTGIGIAPDVAPTVFDLFRQGRRGLDRSQGGLGIGLTLVRTIAELHGGSVDLSSTVGEGSEFTLRLPALPAVAIPGGSVGSAVGSPRVRDPAARVLMVEDNADAAESLVMILELLGHHVRLVADGPRAIAAARANAPDVMLIDIGLPGMNGYELATAIRAEPTLRHVLLVALTGYGRSEDRQRAMAAGFDYHLTKPVDVRTLGELVARATAAARDTSIQ